MSSWMLFSLLIGGLVALAAIAAHDAQHAAQRAVRWIWFGAMGAMVALSIAAPFRRESSSMRVTMPDTSTSVDASMVRVDAPHGVRALWARSRDVIIVPIEAALQVVEATLARVPAPLQRGLAGIWLLASVATLSVFVVSYLRIRRVMRRWPVQRIDNVNARIAPTAGPAVVGLAPSEIILPAWLLRCPPEEQRLVVAHESEHVRAGDPWLLVMACGIVACMPWHPALWFALGRLRLAIELDCDRRVLRRGVPAAAYGSLLIELSAFRPALPSAMPAFSRNGSYLERRLVAMTSRPSRFVHARRFGSGLLAAVALMTACESKLPTSADVERMDATTAQRAMAGSGAVHYVVDGTPVEESVAKAISAEKITSIAVSKQRDSISEIRILTKDAPALMKVAGALEESQSVTISEVRIAQPKTDLNVGALGTQSPKRKFDGLLLIDGKVVESSELERLVPEQIESIEVVKGEPARLAYGDPRAKNGVIKVIMKAKR
ncbi:MAG: hypothetical protein IPP90_20605 [Gemmatimonadaceae bacterium]|nr:hypothetical protein [Gemmatimonadaceae bacterium]